MTPDRPLLGIALMLGFCALAPLADAIAKLIGDQVSIGLLLAVRFVIQAVLLLPFVILLQLPIPKSGRLVSLIILRTGLHTAGIGAMFLALRHLPLADAVAIAFVMPFIMLLLGKLVLGEDIGFHRLAACAVGFGGTMLVVQPNFINVGAPALLPLMVAVVFALFMLVTRKIAKQVDAITLQFISGIIASLVLIPFLILAPSDWKPTMLAWPSQINIILLLALGGLGTFAHLMMTWSLRFAPTTTLAPMQYLEIPFAVAIGWVVFSDFPDGLAGIGISITVMAGLYVIHRERLLAQRLPV